MRILQLHERTELKGGAEVYIDQLNQLLPKYGHQSFWLGKDSLGKHPENYLDEFITGNGIDVISVHNIFDINLVSFCLRRLPVIKFAHGPVMVCPGKDKFWRHSEECCTIKYGLHCFRHIYSEGCANRHPKRVLDAWNYVNFEVKKASKRYKKIIVMSDYIKERLTECGICDTSIICNPYFTPEASVVPSEYGKKSLLFVGRLISSKGPHIMLEALMPILENRNDVHLDIVGDGIMKDELMSLVEKTGVSDNVTFHGWLNRDETDRLLQQSYLVLFPSVYPEAFGIVGIEAMMRAKPVVAFNVGGVSTWLTDGETGFFVEPKDKKAMRVRTEMLLNDTLLYNDMSRRARLQALARFTAEKHMERLLEVYGEALK